ncbi:MAG: WYL domain-containing protein [Anaerolineae bacterium]|nr:WYL domain-containing protein [Anaerolineae bacterium]
MTYALSDAIWDVPLVFLDVETTGLSPARGDRVCEIALLRTRGEEVLDGLQQLINPQRPMGPGAQAVHGITAEMVRDAPKFVDVAERVLELLSDGVLVGHNTRFDMGFLVSELDYAGRRLPEITALDTLLLARSCYRLRSYSLGRLAEALQVEVHGRSHRAMIDVLLTRGVFWRIVADLLAAGVRSLADLVALQGTRIVPNEPDPDIPPAIRRALAESRLLWLHYRSESGEESERFVRPLGVRNYGGGLLLVAHCLLKDARRSFRLDRIIEVELIEDSS